MTADPGFEEWYRAEHPKVLAAILVRADDRGLAEEVVAEAFARALERWERVRGMRSPGGWTYRVARNLLTRRLRRRRLERRAADAQPAEPEVLPERDPALWQAVRALPVRQREAVVFRYVADLPEHEVAERMGVAVGTVAATLHAARARLAATLITAVGREPQDE